MRERKKECRAHVRVNAARGGAELEQPDEGGEQEPHQVVHEGLVAHHPLADGGQVFAAPHLLHGHDVAATQTVVLRQQHLPAHHPPVMFSVADPDPESGAFLTRGPR